MSVPIVIQGRYPLALYVTNAERTEIDSFFDKNPALKKGETIKLWVLQQIRNAKEGMIPITYPPSKGFDFTETDSSEAK